PPYENHHSSAHNQFLQLLFNSGLPGLILFLVLSVFILKDSVSYLLEWNFNNFYTVSFCLVFIFTFFVLGLVEFINLTLLSIILGQWYVSKRLYPNEPHIFP
ncbi:MAG: hypothetical protein ABEJ65_04045, partial [bacterium]